MATLLRDLICDYGNDPEKVVPFALGYNGDEQARKPLIRLLGSTDLTVVEAARQALTMLEMKRGNPLHDR
jgi:HEAT repeat protein